MKRLLCAILLLCGGCLWGCQTAGPKNFDEAMMYVDKLQTIAEKQGLAWSADVTWSGSPEVYERTAFGFNTGLGVVFHVQGNAK